MIPDVLVAQEATQDVDAQPYVRNYHTPAAYEEPPTPTRPDFPSKAFLRPLPLPGVDVLTNNQYYRSNSQYYAPIDGEPRRIFELKRTRSPSPVLQAEQRATKKAVDGAKETATVLVHGLKSAVSGIRTRAAGLREHRARGNGKTPGLGMSLELVDSFLDFHAKTSRPEDLPRALKNPKSRVVAKSTITEPAKPRTVKVVGDPQRGTMIEDFMGPEVFQSCVEGNITSPRIQPKGIPKNRGDSKPLPPLPIESLKMLLADATDAPHLQRSDTAPPDDFWTGRPSRLGPSKRPRTLPPVDPGTPVNWADIEDCQFPTNTNLLFDSDLQTFAKKPADNDAESQQRDHEDDDDIDIPADELFPTIDEAVHRYRRLAPEEKQWASRALHRTDATLRERRFSAESIIIDTFPHDAHTSWRATERTDELTIHVDHARFSRELHEDVDERDSAGLLMEKLGREMMGTEKD